MRAKDPVRRVITVTCSFRLFDLMPELSHIHRILITAAYAAVFNKLKETAWSYLAQILVKVMGL